MDGAQNDPGSSAASAADAFKPVFEGVSVGIHVTDMDGGFIAVNPAFAALLERTPGELEGMTLAEVTYPDDRDAQAQLLTDSRSRSRPYRQMELRYVRKSGQAIWIRLSVAFTPGDAANPPRYVSTIEDITERKRSERQLQYKALHDPLTGLPNRMSFQERLQRLIHSHPVEESGFAVLLLVLDRLKEINETFGRSCGEGLLQQMGTRVRGVVRPTDTVARLEPDEFALLLPDADSDLAEETARNVLTTMSAPFDIGDQSLDVDVNIGISHFPEYGSDTRTLLEKAGIAVQAARRAQSGYAFYQADHGAFSQRHMSLASALRRAIDAGQLVLHYQPKVDFGSGKIAGAEALVRWNHPTLGMVYPGEFIPLAEHTGSIKPLTRWVLHEAIEQCRTWRDQQLDLDVVVNFSARILHDHRLVEMVEMALDSFGLPAAHLGLEITESAVMVDPVRALAILNQLHEIGVSISIDDFGTGYSSFAYLDQLPASEIKIDRSFVRDMVRNPGHFRIVHGTIDIGHDLGLTAVAEGVEDLQTLEALGTLGCDVAQGFYLSHPLPADEFTKWVREREATPSGS